MDLPRGRFCRAILVVAVVLASAWPTTGMADHVSWSPNVESALRTANATNRLVLMKFTAEWCGPCKKFERETFSRPAVAQFVNQNFVPVLVDIDKHKELAAHLKITSVPALLIVSPEMIILSRTTGFQTEQKLLPKLHKIVATHARPKLPVPGNIAGTTALPTAATRPVSQHAAAAGTVSTVVVGSADSLPPGVNSPAFGGLCLSAVQETRSLVSGMPELALMYRGRLLYFSSAEQLQNFRTNPEKYWPQRDGCCPVTLSETGQTVEGMLKYAAIFRGKLWVLCTAEKMKKFVAQPSRYVISLPTGLAKP
ncbi:MAG: thioredoxin family protein [Fuerstiella sp.]